MEQLFVVGALATPVGEVPRVATRLGLFDHLGTIAVRCGIGRMNYTVEPGLYGVNAPSPDSPVLVTANYKLSFDHLRRYLGRIDAWLLVLDTDGINVWCAAGKGSFGTANLVRQLHESGLAGLVNHKKLVVPQLGAPGISAQLIKEATGFTVRFGPVAALDLPAFLAAGMRATPAMRRKDFPLAERAALIPVELLTALKWGIWFIPLLLLLAGLGDADFAAGWRRDGMWGGAAILSGITGGAVLTPLLLPWLPGRAFSLKGLGAGLLAGGGWLAARSELGPRPLDLVEGAAWLLLIVAIASFLAFQFTGASTYTSLSGVKRELRLALPWQIGAVVAGCALLIMGRIF